MCVVFSAIRVYQYAMIKSFNVTIREETVGNGGIFSSRRTFQKCLSVCKYSLALWFTLYTKLYESHCLPVLKRYAHKHTHTTFRFRHLISSHFQTERSVQYGVLVEGKRKFSSFCRSKKSKFNASKLVR